jgi:hypothetical protein
MAVSAVMPRLPWTISLMRRGGTPIETASLFCVIPKASMKSSIRISPGWIGSILSASVVVDELDILRTSLSPDEADAPLVVHPDAVLTAAVACQPLEPVARRDAQVLDIHRRVHQLELPQGRPLDDPDPRP